MVDLAILGVVLIWGLNFTIVKVAIAEVHPLAFVLARFVIISAIALASLFFFSRPLRLRTRSWTQLILLGLIGQAGYQYFFSIGISKTSTFHSSLIISSSPLWIAVLSILLGIEKINKVQGLGIIISFAGLVLFLREGATAATDASLLGDLFSLGATLCWAGYTIISKSLLKIERPLEITSFAVLTALPFMIPYGISPALHQDWNLSATAWFALIYSGILPIYVAYLIWAWGLEKIGPIRTSIYTYLVPIVTAIASWIWIRETVSIRQALLAFVVLIGVFVTRFPIGKGSRKTGSREPNLPPPPRPFPAPEQ